MKIYTKTGDAGTTSLIGGKRVPKDDARVEAYGTVDELMAAIACLRDLLAEREAPDAYITDAERIIRELMIVSALLALEPDAPEALKAKLPALPADAIERLEARIDAIGATLPEWRRFVLPGGQIVASLAHLCRTVCRRAERRCVAAGGDHPIDPQAIQYLNRLSDYLYVVSRALTLHFKIAETLFS